MKMTPTDTFRDNFQNQSHPETFRAAATTGEGGWPLRRTAVGPDYTGDCRTGRPQNLRRRDAGDGSLFPTQDGRWSAHLEGSSRRPRYLTRATRAEAKQRLVEAQAVVVHVGQLL